MSDAYHAGVDSGMVKCVSLQEATNDVIDLTGEKAASTMVRFAELAPHVRQHR